jgi:DNA-binding NarL/FixJ family response regulator
MTLDAQLVATEHEGIRVAVFDRRPLVADGFAALLAQSAGVDIVGVGTSAHDIARLLDSTPVDVVVVGIAAPDVKATARFLGRIPEDRWADGPRLVGIVSGDQDIADVIGGPQVTVITTRTDPDTLQDVVISATPGGVGTIPSLVVWPPAASERQVGAQHPDLTPREQEVLRGIENGLSTNEIALRLGIAPNTVRTHAQRLMSKLSVHSRVQAAAIAAVEDHSTLAG